MITFIASRDLRRLLAGAAVAALAGCASVGVGTSPSAVANAAPDQRGVIAYATYQVAVAREGDTVATLAARVGTTPEALSQRNGLPPNYVLRGGEVVVLPDGTPRLAPTATTGWSPEQAAAAIDAATAPTPGPPPPAPTDPLIDPIRHRVEPGETVYSIARLYGVTASAIASWNGLGPDMTIRTNQELLIPIVSDANKISSSVENQPGERTQVTPPPIAAQPLPDNVAPGANPQSPELGQYRTPPGGRLQPPVSTAIAQPYDASDPKGVEFADGAGQAVRAASDGEVASVTAVVNEPGLAVLIRHSDDLLTAYVRLADVTVAAGDRVARGQRIGVVAASDTPRLRFEVYRGIESIDPTTYFEN